MAYDIEWVIPKLRKSGKLWNCASSFTIAFVGMVTKVIAGSATSKLLQAEWLNKTTVYNRHIMTTALDERPPDVPLITVSNHHSCFDDPGIWGSLPLRHLCSRRYMRWSLAANDICFTNVAHSMFFMLGKCVPVVRGNGVNQPAIDFCLEQLQKGSWVHIFPEGRVNMNKEELRFKWGVGRLIYDCTVPPIIIPIWHENMDHILPNVEPYVPKFGNKITLNYGKPIKLEDTVDKLRKQNATPEEARKAITDRVQEELFRLRDETLSLMADQETRSHKKEL